MSHEEKEVQALNAKPSKTKTSFYRRLYVAWLIESGVDSVPALIEATGMPRRTAQDTISALHEIDILVEHIGSTKAGQYRVKAWGAIDRVWLEANLQRIQTTLGYPPGDLHRRR